MRLEILLNNKSKNNDAQNLSNKSKTTKTTLTAEETSNNSIKIVYNETKEYMNLPH